MTKPTVEHPNPHRWYLHPHSGRRDGRWFVETGGDKYGLYGSEVATFHPDQEEEARMLCASHDMLAALEGLLASIGATDQQDGPFHAPSEEAVDAARAAVARAKERKA